MSVIKDIGHSKQMLELPEAKQASQKSGFKEYLKNCIEGVDTISRRRRISDSPASPRVARASVYCGRCL